MVVGRHGDKVVSLDAREQRDEGRTPAGRSCVGGEAHSGRLRREPLGARYLVGARDGGDRAGGGPLPELLERLGVDVERGESHPPSSASVSGERLAFCLFT